MIFVGRLPSAVAINAPAGFLLACVYEKGANLRRVGVFVNQPARCQLGNFGNVQVSEPVAHSQHCADPFQKYAAPVG